jgi:hypothetical protein
MSASVADQHHVDVDPDPDPTFHSYVDPDSDPDPAFDAGLEPTNHFFQIWTFQCSQMTL